MNFKINQNNGIIESNVPDDIVELLYQETKNYNSHNQESLIGRIEITRGFQDAVDFLNVNYSNLIVTSKFDPYIRFKDSIMESVLIQALLNNGNIGDGIGLTIANLNAASSSAIFNSIKGNTQITKFPEFAYMTNFQNVAVSAFYNCSNLEEVDLTNVKSISGRYFCYGTNLHDIYLPSCTSITANNVFEHCYSLVTFNAPLLETLTGAETFADNGELTTVNMPLVSNIPSTTFSYCTKLSSLTLDFEHIKSIGSSAFKMCSQLPQFDLSNVETFGNAVFFGCVLFENVDLSNCTSLGTEVFSRCTGLKTVSNISKDVTNNDLKITKLPDSTFYLCSSLMSVDLSNITEIEIGNDVFYEDISLSNIDLSNVRKVGNRAFYKCTSLTALNGENITTIGLGGFSTCSALRSINLTNCTNAGDAAFYNCTELTTITGIENILLNNAGHGIFAYCSNLTFPNNVITNGTYDEPNVTYYIGGYAFSNCNITKVTLNNTVKKIYNGAFNCCENLTQVIGLENLTHIDGYIFNNCKNLQGVINLSNVQDYVGKQWIRFAGLNFNAGNTDGIFNNCQNITKVIINHLPAIYSSSFSPTRNQFYNNYKLHTVDIGSLDKIYLGTGALFRECNLMTNLILRKDSVIPIELDTDRMSNITSWTYNIMPNTNGKIFVPDNLVNSYKSAQYWSVIADHIYPLSEYVPVED